MGSLDTRGWVDHGVDTLGRILPIYLHLYMYYTCMYMYAVLH